MLFSFGHHEIMRREVAVWATSTSMNARDAHPIDITGVPEILRIVEEVRTTNSPRILRRDSEDVAVLMPLQKPRVAQRSRAADEWAVERLLAGYGAVTPIKRPEDFGALRQAFEEGVAEETAADGKH